MDKNLITYKLLDFGKFFLKSTLLFKTESRRITTWNDEQFNSLIICFRKLFF